MNGTWHTARPRRDERWFAEGPRSCAVALLLTAGIIGGGVATAPPALAAPDWRTLTATPADAFVNTIGVAIHENYRDTAYGRHDLLALLQRIGVRQIRDGANESSMDFYRRFVEQAGPGAGVSYVVDARNGGSTADQIRMIATEAPGTASQIESDNEPDCDGWDDGEVARYHDQAVEMRTIMDGLPDLEDVPLTTPSFCRTSEESYFGYGDDGASDRFNMHPYVAGYLPEAEIGQFLEWAREADPDAVPVVTEGGFHNAVNQDGGHRPTSEEAESAYLPQMFLEYADRGIALTHTYELLDLDENPGRDNDQKNFGLYRSDGTLKPAGASLAAMIATLSDPGSAQPEDREVRLNTSGGGEELRTDAFVRQDGSIDVVLWRAQEIWDSVARRDLPEEVEEVTVTVPERTMASYVRVDGTEDPDREALPDGSTFTVPVSAHPTILRLGAVPEARDEPAVGSGSVPARSSAGTRAQSGPGVPPVAADPEDGRRER